MAKRRRTTPKQKKPSQKNTKKQNFLLRVAVTFFKKIKQRTDRFLSRRPHRSLRLTRRRDYKRNLQLPGYWSFTNQVRRLLWKNKWLFLKFTALYALLTGLILGIMSQENYQALSQTIRSIGDDALSGQLSQVGQSLVVSTGIISGLFQSQPSQAQQVYGGLLFLLGWMSAIWLLRQVMAGHKKVRLRDGLYSSGAPLVSTFLIFMVVLLQIIPFALAVVAYATATSLNVFDSLLFSSLFWSGELLLLVLSLYWLSNSLIAFVVVTLPGMYPVKAMKSASDLVIGRRLRLLYRLAWLLFSLIVIWSIALVLAVSISSIPIFEIIPIVPLTVLVLSSISLLWVATYIYLLYRKLVDDGSAPA